MRKLWMVMGVITFIACNTQQSVEVIDAAVSTGDTLVYFHENAESKQQLKVVFTSDSTIWYALGFENVTGTKLLEGEGVDIYYNLDPEIEEFNGEAQPVLEYEATTNNKGLVIRVDMMEKDFAKVITTPEYKVNEKPLEVMLLKR